MKRNRMLKQARLLKGSCLCCSGFKRSCAMVGSSGNDHSMVVDRGDRFVNFWPLFPLPVPRELRATGWLAPGPTFSRVLFF
jgi:hypothetical protein